MKAIHKEVKASKSMAIQEVAKSFNVYQMAAYMLYSYKGKSIQEESKGLNAKMFRYLIDCGLILESDDWLASEAYSITEYGHRIIEQIDARFETRHGVKYGYDLFPYEANIPELIAPQPYL